LEVVAGVIVGFHASWFSATVRLPRAQILQISVGERALSSVEGIHNKRQDYEDAIIEIGLGRYVFSYPAQDR
jgi:hypothetical protein